MAQSPVSKDREASHARGNADMEALLVNETQALNELGTEVRSLKVNIANPGPLGLFAFGFTTVLSMMITVGAVSGGSKIMLECHGIFHGGIVQLIAGLWDFRKGNLFPGTVFCTYGAFWLIDMSIMYLATTNPTVWAVTKDGKALWMAEWALFTFLMGSCTLYTNRVLQFVFCCLFFAFCFLSGGAYNRTVEQIGGALGIITGLAAIYLAWAEFANEVYKSTVLPIWPVKRQ